MEKEIGNKSKGGRRDILSQGVVVVQMSPNVAQEETNFQPGSQGSGARQETEYYYKTIQGIDYAGAREKYVFIQQASHDHI